MVEIVAFAISLHDVGALFVVDVLDAFSFVGRDALAVQPVYVRASDGVRGERAELLHREGLGGDARAVAEDASPGGGGEHGVAEAVDEVWCGCCFA